MPSLADNYVDVTEDRNIMTKEIPSTKVEMTSDCGDWYQRECDI